MLRYATSPGRLMCPSWDPLIASRDRRSVSRSLVTAAFSQAPLVFHRRSSATCSRAAASVYPGASYDGFTLKSPFFHFASAVLKWPFVFVSVQQVTDVRSWHQRLREGRGHRHKFRESSSPPPSRHRLQLWRILIPESEFFAVPVSFQSFIKHKKTFQQLFPDISKEEELIHCKLNNGAEHFKAGRVKLSVLLLHRQRSCAPCRRKCPTTVGSTSPGPTPASTPPFCSRTQR